MELSEPLYVDTSALVKLIVPETESAALLQYLSESDHQLTSSELCEVELTRAVRRVDPARESDAEALLEQMFLLPLNSSIRTRAAHVPPEQMKSMDAIHLATAVEIQASLTWFLSYDKTLNDAARAVGLQTVSPA